MVEIIERNEGAHECSCNSCGSKLLYKTTEVKEDYSTDYTGGRDYYKYIICPVCNYKITYIK